MASIEVNPTEVVAMGEKAKHTAELLRECKSYPGYAVTNTGRVFSIASNWRGYGNREMQQTLNDDGYPSVRISVKGKRKHIAVHRIVADSWLPYRPSVLHEIRHLDGCKFNRHCDNLAWGTRKQNADDRARHGRTSRGVSHSTAIKAGLERGVSCQV